MDIETAIEEMEREWDEIEAEGFFGKLRYGSVFDETGFQRVKDILLNVELPLGEVIDKRFVEVTWFIPVFMLWQRQGWAQDGKDTEMLDKAIDSISQALTRVLGLP